MSTSGVELILAARSADIGGFAVLRALPQAKRRMVGPFIFLDQMGPASLAPGAGTDVLPHPHIGLSTVTYLFEGELHHKDTLGSSQVIRPGDVNWMTAGKGIAHAEHTPDEVRAKARRLFGIQIWVALPAAHEETAPAFTHHPKASLPVVDSGGVTVRVVAGNAFGVRSPVKTHSELFYADASLEAGAVLELPPEHEERAVFAAQGDLELAEGVLRQGELAVLERGEQVLLRAGQDARALVFGGAALESPRHIWWNFVSSSRERIEQAKADWKAQRFGVIEGETAFVPLPER